MQTRLIGDVHGKFVSYTEKVLRDWNGRSIQLGDFGLGFGNHDLDQRVSNYLEKTGYRFIRGNHDNPAVCKMTTGWIPDCTVESYTMMIGGAWSIDHMMRIPGVDWWRDEELSYRELDEAVDLYERTKPRVMLTHDTATVASYKMFVRENESLGGRTLYLTRTGEALQQMLEIHQPEFWFFGHWHKTKVMDIDGTTFVCLNELDYIDVDLEDSKQMREAVESLRARLEEEEE